MKKFLSLLTLLGLSSVPSLAQRWFEPSCGEYFGLSVKQLGFIPGVLSTADRITRTGRISAADRVFISPDGLVHEGPEAYSGKLSSSATGNSTSGIQGGQQYGFQDNPTGRPVGDDDLQFILYLLDNGMSRDARAMLTLYSPSDTLNYLRGWTAYNSKLLQDAADAFRKVNESSPFYDRSVFYGAICSAHSGNYEDALQRLDSYEGPLTDLRDSQAAGLKSILAVSPSGKSPALAACLSAIIPGSGKIYAGRLGEGISALLVNGVFAAITADQWIHNGPSDWKTILACSVGTIFYIGNIYGSYFSVSIYNHEDMLHQQNALLYNLHISLRDSIR